MSTDLTTQDSAALAASEDLEAQLAAQNQSEVDESDFRIPILKVAQSGTAEVKRGEAEEGEFIDTLTGTAYASPIEFVVAHKNIGRFMSGDHPNNPHGRTLAADGNIVPWNDDPFKGQPFSEHPDAEEQYSKRVNESNGKIRWGKGPAIQTTMNYTGFIIQTKEDGERELLEIPMRLSVRLTNKEVKGFKQKFNTLLDAVLRGRFWEETFIISTTEASNAKGQTYYVPSVARGVKTTAEQKAAAVQLAQIVRTQNVVTVGDDSGAEGREEPADTGGIAV